MTSETKAFLKMGTVTDPEINRELQFQKAVVAELASIQATLNDLLHRPPVSEKKKDIPPPPPVMRDRGL